MSYQPKNIDNQCREVLVCRKCAQEKALQVKLEEKIYQEDFVSYVEAYYELSPSIHTLELAHNKPQHKKRSLPGIFPPLISPVEPSPVHIFGTLKLLYVDCQDL